MSKNNMLGIFVIIFLNLFSIISSVPPPCNYVQNQGYSCNQFIQPSIQYYYHIASRTCQPFMYLGCGGNGNRFGSRNLCMSKCQHGAPGIGQGTQPSGPNGIGQGTRPGGIGTGTISTFESLGIGQGTQPGGFGIGQGTTGPGNNGIGQGTQPTAFGSPGIGQGTGKGIISMLSRNPIGNGTTSNSMPSIGQGVNGTGSTIGQGTSSSSSGVSGIGQGTHSFRVINPSTPDIFNPFHPGPVKTSNGSWPAPVTPQTPTTTKDFINGYAQMCDASFGLNIKVPTSCGASDSCPKGFQCSGNFCCPTKETACFQESDSGHELNEQEHVGRYAYQPSLKSCLRFSYFGSDGNFNNFKTYNECMRFCNGI